MNGKENAQHSNNLPPNFVVIKQQSQLKWSHHVSVYKNKVTKVVHSSTQNENQKRKNSKCPHMVLIGLCSSPPELALHHGS